jgi:Cobalamin synthesis protein cobW C-terminal domain
MIVRCSGESAPRHFAQHRAAMLVRPGCFGIGSGIARVHFFWGRRGVAPAPQFLERLEARNRKQPGRRSGAPLKLVRMPPNREKNLAGEVVGARRIADEAQDEAIDARLVAREQDVHREPVAGCDPRDQRGVRHVRSRARRRRDDQRISSLSLTSDQPMNAERFIPWIQDVTQNFGMDILRMKGIIAMKDDDQRFVIQGVHMLIEGDRQRPWKTGEKRESRLIFIGRNLPKDLLKQGFEACRA